MKLTPSLCSVLLLCTLCVSAAIADSKVFKIELLIFAQDKPSSEVFDQTYSEIDWPRRLADLSSFHQVKSEHRSLYGVKANLRSHSSYRPLLHVAWTQKVRSHSLSTAVHVRSPSGDVNGYFRMQRGHYLHISTDLEYSPGDQLVYRLNEKRRIKLNEMHYLDHPKFGIIAKVSPISSH